MSPRARKRFGQHFLHDEAVISQIITAIGPQAHEHLLEIGPGRGALTGPLLRHVDQLDVVELDRDLAPTLLPEQQSSGALRVHQRDALTLQLAELGRPKLRVVGNLPYNISTPLLFHLLTQTQYIEDMTFMLQREVAQRIGAAPGGSDYGRLSVMLQYHCQVSLLFDVGPNAFTPPPRVDSTVIHLRPHQPMPTTTDTGLLGQVVAQAFSQRRKTLRNSLRTWLDADDLAAVGIDPERRAQTLSVAEFVQLTALIQSR